MSKPNYLVKIIECDDVWAMRRDNLRSASSREKEVKLAGYGSLVNPFYSMTIPNDWMNVDEDDDVYRTSPYRVNKESYEQHSMIAPSHFRKTSLLEWPPQGAGMLLFLVQVQPDLWITDEFVWINYNRGDPRFFGRSVDMVQKRREGAAAHIRQLFGNPI